MNRFRLASILALTLVYGSLPAQSPTSKPHPLRVLLIGNSYTYFNQMPKMLEAISRSLPGGRPVSTTMIAPGGMTLARHLRDGQVARTIKKGQFDIVVLQEQSTRPIEDKERMYEAVRKFHTATSASKTRLVLFTTWAREHLPKTQVLISKAYTGIARELGVTTAPVGPTWRALRKKKAAMKLYNKDRSHPSPEGSYLTACVLYATLTGKSPVGATHRIVSPLKPKTVLVDLDKDTAKQLQSTAWTTARALVKAKAKAKDTRRKR